MASKGELPQEYFGRIDNHNAGMLLGELIEPSTKEEYLSREYLELRSAGLNINEVIKMISDGDFSTIEEAFRDFIDRYVSVLAQKATRATGIQFQEDDIARKFEEKQVSLDNLNSAVEDTLVELYYIYKN
jgi:DNA-binding transcriptional MerR regulator